MIVGRLGAGTLARFALARGATTTTATAAGRLTQLVVEVLGQNPPTAHARVTQYAVEVLGPYHRQRFRVVMI
jgi:hypothetical protein